MGNQTLDILFYFDLILCFFGHFKDFIYLRESMRKQKTGRRRLWGPSPGQRGPAQLSACPRRATGGPREAGPTGGAAGGLSPGGGHTPPSRQDNHILRAYLGRPADYFIVHIRDSHHHDDVATKNPGEDPADDIKSDVRAAREETSARL